MQILASSLNQKSKPRHGCVWSRLAHLASVCEACVRVPKGREEKKKETHLFTHHNSNRDDVVRWAFSRLRVGHSIDALFPS